MRTHVTRFPSLTTSLIAVLAIAGSACSRRCLAQDRTRSTRESAALASLTKLAGDGFRGRETARFLIAFDTPHETVTPFLGRLEGTHGAVMRFLRALPFESRATNDPLRVILFRDFDGFSRFTAASGIASPSVAGVYDPVRDLAAFCDTMALPQVTELRRRLDEAAAWKRDAHSGAQFDAELIARRAQLDVMVGRFNRFVVQHEATHQILFHAGLHVRGSVNPVWFVEGMACQFEVSQPDPTGRLLQVNHVRLADLRDALGVSPNDKDLTPSQRAAAVAAGRWLPLRNLLADSTRFHSPNADSGFAYAQAWGLVFYLHRERRDGLARYARTVSQRRPGDPVDAEQSIQEFERALGPADAEFEGAWIRYLLAQRLDRAEAGR